MTPQLPKTDTSATVKTVSVADYIVERALPKKESSTALALPAITCFRSTSIDAEFSGEMMLPIVFPLNTPFAQWKITL
jgi:hypothetical protein